MAIKPTTRYTRRNQEHMKTNGLVLGLQLQHIPRVKERQTESKDSSNESRHHGTSVNERVMRCCITNDVMTISNATKRNEWWNATTNTSQSYRRSAYYVVDTFFINTLALEKDKNQYKFQLVKTIFTTLLLNNGSKNSKD